MRDVKVKPTARPATQQCERWETAFFGEPITFVLTSDL
jgi:hypothetical protein